MTRALALLALLALPARAEDYTCPPLVAPVVRLDHGSRYKPGDTSHSNFDNASNAEVNAQLKPVDDFITDMVLAANASLSGDAKGTDCALAGLQAWAEAGALTEMGSLNASLSVPSRVAGLAWAWAEVKPKAKDGAKIEAWLTGLAQDSMRFFDTEAPTKSAKNNLRAWAGLAVARVGVTVGDPAMLDWAAATVDLVACQAEPDGSLPLEMARKDLALHYQLHAVTALVPTAVLLQATGRAPFQSCDGALHRAVHFAVQAFADPGAITKRAGVQQSYFDGSDKLQGFELAWAPAYLATFYAPDLARFVEPFAPLANSKLGGLQSLLFP